MLKYFNCFQPLQLNKWQLPSICTFWDTGSLNYFHFESFSSYIIQVYIFVYIFMKLAIFILFLLSSTVMFFLHCMLNILRYEKTFCEIDESVASWHDPSSEVIFLGVHIVNPFFLLCSIFFLKKTVSFGLYSSCLLLIAELITSRYFW